MDILRSSVTIDDLERQAAETEPPVSVGQFLQYGRRHVIAEVKRASPSKGVIDGTLEPAALSREYESGGASAVSVLTDEKFFHGSDEDIRRVRATVRLPILRKDFIIDDVQVLQSRILGADLILLIVRILTDAQLRHLSERARALSMSVLMEAHSQEELRRAIGCGTTMIGINNRDLDTFEVTRRTSLELRDHISEGVFCVSESGIDTPSDAHELFAAGYDAVLIGEGIVRSRNRTAFIKQVLDV